MAGLDGIENKIDPGDPLDKDIYALSPEELKDVPSMPGSLDEALDNLENDHEFLLKGDVFTEDVIETWIEYKRTKEVDADPAASASVRVRALLRHLSRRRSRDLTKGRAPREPAPSCFSVAERSGAGAPRERVEAEHDDADRDGASATLNAGQWYAPT